MWVWRWRSSLRGFCVGTVVPWSLAPFYRCCGWRCRTWVGPVLLAWTYHCFRLGAWSLGLASSSVACHPSPSHGLARLGVRVCLHFLKCCLYYFLEILDLISSESLVPSAVTFDSFSSSSSSHLHARAHTVERVGVLVCVFIHQPPDPQRPSGSPH